MQSVILFLFFIFGLLFGSFFNVVGLRVPNKQSIVAPPSHCPGCSTRLKPIDLIPVLSYFTTLGRCRYCKTRISAIYPIMELITGFLFAAVYYVYGFTPEAIMVLLFFSMLVIITVSDLAYRLIPDKVLLPFFLIFLVMRFFIHPDETYISHLVGMVLGFTIFFVIALLSKGGVGGGDIKLYAVIGLFFGYPLLLVTILLSTFLGSIYGIFIMLLQGANRKTEVPFGPFIAFGSVVALFFGYDLINWYVQRFF